MTVHMGACLTAGLLCLMSLVARLPSYAALPRVSSLVNVMSKRKSAAV